MKKRLSVLLPAEDYETLQRLAEELNVPLTKFLQFVIRYVGKKFEEDPDATILELIKAVRDKKVARERAVGPEKEEESEAPQPTTPAPVLAEKTEKEEEEGRENRIEQEKKEDAGAETIKEKQKKKPSADEIYQMFLKRIQGG